MTTTTVTITDSTGATQSVNTLPPVGPSNAAGSLPVVSALDDPSVVALGAKTDSIYTDISGVAAGSSISLLKGILGKISTMATSVKQDALLAALGSPLQAGGSIGISGSLPAFASTPTVNIGSVPTITISNSGFTATQSGTWNINNISGVISLPTGAATDTNQIVQTTAQQAIQTQIGATTSPVSGSTNYLLGLINTSILSATPSGTNSIGTVGLNAGNNAIGSITNTTFASTQSGTWNINNISGAISLPTGAATDASVTTMSAKLPSSLGSKPSAGSISVTPASDVAFYQVSSSIATSQNTVNSTASSVVAARAGRKSVMIENHGNVDVYLGGSGVAANTGILLPGTKGASITLDTSAAIYAVTASGSVTISNVEIY